MYTKCLAHWYMPRIDIRVPPYIVTPVKVRSAVSRVGLSGILGRQQESPCDVMMTWLRLKSPVKCIPHPYDNDTYTKCFSFFICWGFTCGSTLTQWYISAGLGWVFEITGVDPTPCNVLQQASDWITNLYWMYTKCFGTLICWVWAYGTTLTLFRICRSGVDLGFWG